MMDSVLIELIGNQFLA